MLLQEYTTREVVGELMEKGVSRVTAYRWVKKVREELAIARHP